VIPLSRVQIHVPAALIAVDRLRKTGAIGGSSDLDSLFNFLELLHYGFKTGQTGNRTFLILVEFGPRAAILLDPFLYEVVDDLSDEHGPETLTMHTTFF